MWLERYRDPRVINRRGAFHLYSCLDEVDRRRVVVVGDPAVDQSLVTPCLDEVARVHRLIDSPHVPKVAHRGRAGDVELLAFDCDGVRTLEELFLVKSEVAQEHQSFQLGLALEDAMAGALSAAHRALDPTTGSPVAMGTFAWSNVLVSAAGHVWLIGFGHLLSSAMLTGSVAPGTDSFSANELKFGAAPTPVSDVCGLTLLMLSLLPYARGIPSFFVQRGLEPGAAASGEVAALIEATRVGCLDTDPSRRFASMRERQASMARIWGHFDLQDETAAWLSDMVRLADDRAPAEAAPEAHGSTAAPRGPQLVVGRDGRWFRLGHEPAVDLTRRGGLRMVLATLAARHLDAPGAATSTMDLLDAGWPGEPVMPDVGARRVYTTVWTFRKLGLASCIAKHDDGYLLEASVRVALSEDAAPPS